MARTIPLVDVLAWDAEAVDPRRERPDDMGSHVTQGTAREDKQTGNYREQRSVTIADALLPEGWTREGACRDRPDVDFFPARGESLEPAYAVCGGCPVRHSCLLHAMLRPERFGVWGGTSEQGRRRLKKAARRAVGGGKGGRRAPIVSRGRSGAYGGPRWPAASAVA